MDKIQRKIELELWLIRANRKEVINILFNKFKR